MNAAETIQAAIDKLEALREAAKNMDQVWRGIGEYFDDADVELVEMLHRTIDAQLAILRAGLRGWMWQNDEEAANLLHLARSILGEES